MSDRFEEELMEDLAAEPEARSHAMDEFDEGDEFELDAGDEFDAGDDEFDAGDEFDAMDEFEDAFEGEVSADEFEDAMADALDAADTDEFFGKIGGFLKKAAKGVGKVARVVAPIAKMIPIPQVQMIGRIADVVGKNMADEGDEMDAFEDLADYAEEADAVDVLAPAIATVALHHGLKNKAAQLTHPQRRELVKTVTAAARHLNHKHGPKALSALPVIAAHANRIAARKHLPSKLLPKVVAKTASTAAKSPRVLRNMVAAGNKVRGHRRKTRHGLPSRHRHGSASHNNPSRSHRSSATGSCPGCGGRRSLRFSGPVKITIEGA